MLKEEEKKIYVCVIFTQCDKVSHSRRISLVNVKQVKVTSGTDGSPVFTIEAGVTHYFFSHPYSVSPASCLTG